MQATIKHIDDGDLKTEVVADIGDIAQFNSLCKSKLASWVDGEWEDITQAVSDAMRWSMAAANGS